MTVSLLQLSDPHLLADPQGRHRGVAALPALRRALQEGLARCPCPPDLLLISGDLCQDESWLGYAALRDLLAPLPLPVALLAGNHDHPQLLRSALGRTAVVAPALLEFGAWRLLLLDSHCSGQINGRLSALQVRWAQQALQGSTAPVLLAVHHPPEDFTPASPWLQQLAAQVPLKLLLVGHIHQHRQEPTAAGPVLLGCPSTLLQFSPRQPCPLGMPQEPGGRWLQLGAGGHWRTELLRWSA
ncbi:MAG: metallophosphoesterase [Synechococcus sp.]|nr:metallophosphoesterase [Synechococcus sp.]